MKILVLQTLNKTKEPNQNKQPKKQKSFFRNLTMVDEVLCSDTIPTIIDFPGVN